MAIAKHKTRYPVTLEDRLILIIKREAERLGVHASQLAAYAVEQYFIERDLFTPENAEWKTKITAAEAPSAGQQSPSAS